MPDLVYTASQRTAPAALDAQDLAVRATGSARRVLVSTPIPHQASAMERLEAALGGAIVRGPRVTRRENLLILPLGPRDWWLEETSEGGLESGYAKLLDDPKFATAEVSDAIAGVVVTGSAAQDLASIGCALDLRPERFGPDGCARTLFGKVDALIFVRETGFELRFDRSYTVHVWRWLETAVQEFLD